MLERESCVRLVYFNFPIFSHTSNQFWFLSHNFPGTTFFFFFSKSPTQRESDRRMATEHITRTSDQYNVELLPSDEDAPPLSSSWRLSLDTFRLPSSPSSTGHHDVRTRFSRYFRTPSEFVVLRVSLLLFWFRVDHRT